MYTFGVLGILEFSKWVYTMFDTAKRLVIILAEKYKPFVALQVSCRWVFYHFMALSEVEYHHGQGMVITYERESKYVSFD